MELQRLVNDYVVWHEVSGHSPRTIRWYCWGLRTFQRWLETTGRPTSVTDITIGDVRAFLQAEMDRDTLYPGHPTGVERAGKLSDRTLHGYARALRAFFTWLVNEEYLDKNPVARLRPPKLEKRHKDVLSVTEMERLLAELNQRTFHGARMYAMLALLYNSGLRAGEIVSLDAGHIQWSEYQVRVLGKGKKERLVPFSPATQRALRKYLTLRQPFVRDDHDALFISATGARLTRDAVTHAIKRLGQRAGIPRLHPHLLRHSAAVAAVLNGANQFELKRILGHTQLSRPMAIWIMPSSISRNGTSSFRRCRTSANTERHLRLDRRNSRARRSTLANIYVQRYPAQRVRWAAQPAERPVAGCREAI